MTDDSLDLLCIKYDGWQPRIRPGTPRRPWMDATGERYAYRCLPLTIANSHGWELLSPMAFEAKWDGGDGMESVEIRMDSGYAEHLKPVSIFGYGTITWHVEAIFRTPPGWNLHVSGPPNRQKDAIQALGGIIETDWAPYTFTMNWRFTRAEQWIRFEENEPIAFFFPVERGSVERFKPRIERLEDHKDLCAAFEKWSASRNAFQEWVKTADPEAPGDKWQKLYFRGLDQDGKPCPVDHQAKIRLPHFAFPDGSIMNPPEMRTSPMRNRPLPAMGMGAISATASTQPGHALLNYGGGGAAAVNPALALALGRLDLGVKPQPQQAQIAVQVPQRADKDAELALKRRDWLLEALDRQQRLADGDGIARVRDLDGDGFLRTYYAPARPVVIEGALADWPALARWSPNYLGRLIGAKEIEYQDEKGSGRMPFDRFIAELEAAPFASTMAITAENEAANRDALAPLLAETRPLDALVPDDPGQLAIGPAGTFVPLHFDLSNQLIAQVAGTQRFILAPPAEAHRLGPRGESRSAVTDITDESEVVLNPSVRGARLHELDLEAGEILFIPVGWWWQATATDLSVALSYDRFRWANDAAGGFPARLD